jgi:uncharacterized protein YndB with AHSA1/START domain
VKPSGKATLFGRGQSSSNGDDITLPIDTPCLRIVRRFAVSPGVMFDTLTKAESMRVWWDDQTTFDIDLRIGGQWTIIRKDGDTVYTMVGEYLEIERPHRLRYTIAMPQFSPNSDTISVEIAPDGGGCMVTFVQSGVDIASELRDLPPGETSGTEAGYQQGFDLMAAAWAKQAEPGAAADGRGV